LIRYRLLDRTGLGEDDEDCGLVGSMTWCFFSYKMNQRPPEDAYAIHCCWEMENAKLIDEAEVADPAEYVGMLGQWKGDPLADATITRVVELSPELKYPTRLVALATAKLNEQDGWVVLEGPRSTWYPKGEQPAESHESLVWKIHIGRQLLGFGDQPDRKKYLATDRPKRDPQQIIAAYEKLMAEAAEAEPKRQKELLESGTLSGHFDAYVDALATVNGTTKSETTIEIYERFLALAEHSDESIRSDVHDSFSVLGEHFEAYVDAIVSKGKNNSVGRLIELFAPHWDHNLGYGKLGTAAFKTGQRDVAERYFIKLHDGLEDYCRSQEMGLLAEIWHARGETDRARDLLIDCLRGLIKQIKASRYNSDRRTFTEQFQHHRSTFLRLFPNGQPDLQKLGIPETPL
jgi:hypothetical protein